MLIKLHGSKNGVLKSRTEYSTAYELLYEVLKLHCTAMSH